MKTLHQKFVSIGINKTDGSLITGMDKHVTKSALKLMYQNLSMCAKFNSSVKFSKLSNATKMSIIVSNGCIINVEIFQCKF